MGCTKSNEHPEDTLVFKSLESSTNVLNKNRAMLMDQLLETSCRNPHFHEIEVKGLQIDSICKIFYKSVDKYLQLDKISNSDLIELRNKYHSCLDGIITFHKKYGFSDDIKLYALDQTHDVSNNSTNYRVLGLIYKNDVFENEIKTLERIYLIYENYYRFTKRWLACEEQERNENKYSFSARVVEESYPHAFKKVEFDSIMFNRKKVKVDSSKLSFTGDNIIFNSSKRGNYSIYGRVVFESCIGTNEYPFIHNFKH
ncbi:hypothetical protein GYB22_02320 [bacterium]|nr:hypothetical protein [bacterium]